MVKVRINFNASGKPGSNYVSGEVYDFPQDVADRLFQSGKGEPVSGAGESSPKRKAAPKAKRAKKKTSTGSDSVAAGDPPVTLDAGGAAAAADDGD